MKLFVPLTYITLMTAVVLCKPAANAQTEPFKDVPADSTIYGVLADLQQKRILTGYPSGYFIGKRRITRYEFGVALKRALDVLLPDKQGGSGTQGLQGPKGSMGEPGAQGAEGPTGITPEILAKLARLTDDFNIELAAQGVDVMAISVRLALLSKSLDSVNGRLDRSLKIGGEFFTGFCSDQSRYGFIDYGGANRTASRNPLSSVDAIYDFHLTVNASMPAGAKFTGDLVESSYLSYMSSVVGVTLGNTAVPEANPSGQSSVTSLYQAQVSIPVPGLGSNTNLEIGRFKNVLSPLTYYRPNTDVYFNLPWYSDGNYVEDGIKLSSKLGRASAQVFAGSYTNLTTSSGSLINAPLVGALNSAGVGGPTFANQSGGMRVAVPIFNRMVAGVTFLDFADSSQNTAGADYSNVMVYGADLTARPSQRITLNVEADKSVTMRGIAHGDGSNNDDDNAFNLSVGYCGGPVSVQLGYQYIDPRYGAPGYWNKIGPFFNLTNVNGPRLTVRSNLSRRLQGSVEENYMLGSRNRPAYGLLPMTTNSNISHTVAGLKYEFSRTVSSYIEYEGDFFSLSAADTGIAGGCHPWSQYITFGAGIRLSANTMLRCACQVLGYQDRTGYLGFAGEQLSSNANIFTTQVAVRF